jgi:hypothetical protein
VTVVDVLPLASNLGVHPLSGWVLNIAASTHAHVDPMDLADFCGAFLLTDGVQGGSVCLHQAGLVCHMRAGDGALFCSRTQSHFNLHFKGKRASIILQSCKDLLNWYKNCNGWSHHVQ